MSFVDRIKIATAILLSSTLVFGILYLLAGAPDSSNDQFFGAALPISIAGGIVVALLLRQLFKRMTEQSK